MSTIQLSFYTGSWKWAAGAVFLIMILLPLVVGAQTGANIPAYNPRTDLSDPNTAVRDVVSKVANILGTVILAISVVMILFAAFNFLTAGGDAEKITSARNTLIYALVGVAVALLAYVVPTLVQTLIRGS